MTVDDDGMLWVALGRAGAVHRYRADGTLDGVIELPATNPTSVAFGGTDRGDLYITTSWFDLERRQPRRPAPGRRDLPLPPRGDRATRTAVRGVPALTGAVARTRPRPATTRERRHPMIERMVVFGASGDLTSRLLMPAVAQLAEAGLLPPGLTMRRLGQHRLVGGGLPPAHQQ